jgi:serine protease AprX
MPERRVLINNADAWSDNGTPSDSTDDGPVAGSQWNRTYGWGYLNLSNAYAYRLNVGSGTVGATGPRRQLLRRGRHEHQPEGHVGLGEAQRL